MSLEQRHKYQLNLFTFKVVKGMLSHYISCKTKLKDYGTDMVVRAQTRENLEIPRYRLCKKLRVQCQMSKNYNTLLDNVEQFSIPEVIIFTHMG